MEIAVMNHGAVKFQNKQLNTATQEMFKVEANIRANLFHASGIVTLVQQSGCYKDDGFKDAVQWAEKTFGLKKTAVYTMLKIGAEYLTTETNEKGKILGYHTNLLPAGSEMDFTPSQLERIIPLGHEEALKAVESGKIKPEMTVRDIAKVVKELKTPTEESDSTKDEKTENDNKETKEPEETKEPAEVTYTIVTDQAGHAYKIPDSVLMNYIIPDAEFYGVDDIEAENENEVEG